MTAEHKLRFALRANAISSTSFGIAGLIFARQVVDLLGTGNQLLVRLTSIGLLGFAGFVLQAARSPLDRLRSEALLISLGDFCWVAVSFALIITGFFTAVGVVVVGLVAALVLDFGVAQVYTRAKTAVV
ncbi:MAG: hypothetical protein ACN4GZ_11545 [Acidimicrobiales bacterium]